MSTNQQSRPHSVNLGAKDKKRGSTFFDSLGQLKNELKAFATGETTQPPSATTPTQSSTGSSEFQAPSRANRGTLTFSKPENTNSGIYSKNKKTGTLSGDLPSKGSVGKSVLKNLGFKVGKNATLNFYSHWKIPAYPETASQILVEYLKVFGIPEEDPIVAELAGKLYDRLEADAKELPAPVLPRECLANMKTVMDECRNLMMSQRKLESIVKIQALYRGRLFRRRFKAWLDESGEQQKKISNTKKAQCCEAFRDLIQTEDVYIKSLDKIVTMYLMPLKRSLNRRNSVIGNMLLQSINISKQDVDAIFCNVETLLQVHHKIRARFERLQANWPFLDNVGETFINMAPDLIVYGDYVRNCKNALDTLYRVQEEDPKLRSFFEETSSQAGDLMGLLVRPLNHISQYSLLLKVFITNYPPSHPDMENLRNAYTAIKKTTKYIQDSNRQAANRARIGEVQRRLIFKNAIDLAVPKREFIGEGPIVSYEKTLGITMEKQRHYFIFTDLLLIGEEYGKQFKVLYNFNLKEVSIEEGEPTFSLCAPGIKLQLTGRSAQEKQEFLSKVQERVETLSTSGKVFGVPLTKLLEREQPADGIPYIVRSCVEYLRQHREAEGLFRISGGNSETSQLRERFNSGQDTKGTLDLSNVSPHCVASVFKTWFRELPEPLLTFSSYTPITEVAGGGESESANTTEKLKDIVKSIPQSNQTVLRYLFEFLGYVAEVSSVNKMNSSNLAIVFGPNLIYPQEESLEAILMIPKINSVIQLMLENWSHLFA